MVPMSGSKSSHGSDLPPWSFQSFTETLLQSKTHTVLVKVFDAELAHAVSSRKHWRTVLSRNIGGIVEYSVASSVSRASRRAGNSRDLRGSVASRFGR